VADLIRASDAMIGFTTRRDPVGPNQFTTHPWVVQELVTAYTQTPRIAFVEVREEGVVSPGGMLEAVNAQRIAYREADRAACLLQIAQALRQLLDQLNVTTLSLGPAAVVDQIRVLLDDPTFTATSQLLRGNALLALQPVAVFPIRGGLFVKLRGVAEGDLVRITISARGQSWRSSFESMDAYNVDLA
jgi:phage FluMu protein gp41